MWINVAWSIYFHCFWLCVFFVFLCVWAALPPPTPPPLCPLFGSLVNLLQCDVLLAVEGAVLQWAGEPSGGSWTDSMLQRVRHVRAGSEDIEPGSISKTSSGFLQVKSVVSPHTVCLCLQVLHLVGLALLEEHQQLENSSVEDDITFNYTCKITRQYTKAISSKYSSDV